MEQKQVCVSQSEHRNDVTMIHYSNESENMSSQSFTDSSQPVSPSENLSGKIKRNSLKLSLVLSVKYNDKVPKSKVLESVAKHCNRNVYKRNIKPPRNLSECGDLRVCTTEQNPTHKQYTPNNCDAENISDAGGGMDLDMEVISLHILDDPTTIEPSCIEVKNEPQTSLIDPLVNVDEQSSHSIENLVTDNNVSDIKKTGLVEVIVRDCEEDKMMLKPTLKRNAKVGASGYNKKTNQLFNSQKMIKAKVNVDNTCSYEGTPSRSDTQKTSLELDNHKQRSAKIQTVKVMKIKLSGTKQPPTLPCSRILHSLKDLQKKPLKKPATRNTTVNKTIVNEKVRDTIPDSFKLEDHPHSYSIENYTDLARDLRHIPDSEKQCKRFVCKICNSYRTLLTENLKQHIQLHVTGKLDCKTCSFIADTPFNLRRHINESQHESQGSVICELCGNFSANKRSHKIHASKFHGKPAFKCSNCEASFHKRQDMKKHMLSVHESSVFQCDKCKMIFMSKIALENHLKTCAEKLYKCKYCSFVRNSKASLRHHVRKLHAKESVHNCSICTFTATTKSILNHHMNAHLGIHEYSCNICDFSCVKKYQLDSHKRRHTGEKKFKCDKCCYAAAWNVQLKTHMKAHESETQCLCKVCGVVLKDQRCLKLHKQKEHGSAS